MNSTEKQLKHQRNTSFLVVDADPDHPGLSQNSHKSPVFDPARIRVGAKRQKGRPVLIVPHQQLFTLDPISALPSSPFSHFADVREFGTGGANFFFIRPTDNRLTSFRTAKVPGWNTARIPDVC